MPPPPPPPPVRRFDSDEGRSLSRLAEVLRRETTGGLLLLVAALVALVWANSPWSHSYVALSNARPGPSLPGLDLSLAQWSADGLLAVFFFVAGLELKREFIAGDLRHLRRAVLPVAAAVAGMVVPALVYIAVNVGAASGRPQGWAVPTATDIAFALAVLAVAGRRLPAAARAFLLTLAVVDDLLAIVIIAVVFTRELHPVSAVLALLPLTGFAVVVRRPAGLRWLLPPLASATWVLVHDAGIHATVAGVLLGFAVPVHPPGQNRPAGEPGPAERLEHRWRPFSAGVAVPVFAFFAAGVDVGAAGGPAGALGDPVTLGIVAGLVAGKAVGVLSATWLIARFSRAELAPGLAWRDMTGLALLTGVGFTVSLLIGELAFGPGSAGDEHVKVGVLTGSLISAALAVGLLRRRNAHHAKSPAVDHTD